MRCLGDSTSMSCIKVKEFICTSLSIALMKGCTVSSVRKTLLINSFPKTFKAKTQDVLASLSHGKLQSVDPHRRSFGRLLPFVKKQESLFSSLVHRQLCSFAARINLGNSHSCGGLRGFHTSTFASVFAGAAAEQPSDTNISGKVVDSSVSSTAQQQRRNWWRRCTLYLPGYTSVWCRRLGRFWSDAGIYLRDLMENAAAAVQEEPLNAVDPARVLEKAHAKTKAKGSSTACIIALTDQGLHVVNLGDSGFVVIRDGSTVFKSHVQQHEFNFSYQLERGGGDLPSSGEVFRIPVSPGDVIVAGTDGLFDNLYNNEVSGVVVHSVRAGFGPQVAARKRAALARERALDKNRQIPFATAAQDAVFRYHGGKLDDITVIVSYITRSANGNGSAAN